MSELTAEAMPRLRSMKDLSEYWIEINRLENQADQVYRRLLAELFNGGNDAITVMKLKEVIDELEAAADAFEKVAQHGREHRRQGVLTLRGLAPDQRSSSPWRWASTTPTASTTRPTPSRPRSRPGP